MGDMVGKYRGNAGYGGAKGGCWRGRQRKRRKNGRNVCEYG